MTAGIGQQTPELGQEPAALHLRDRRYGQACAVLVIQPLAPPKDVRCRPLPGIGRRQPPLQVSTGLAALRFEDGAGGRGRTGTPLGTGF